MTVEKLKQLLNAILIKILIKKFQPMFSQQQTIANSIKFCNTTWIILDTIEMISWEKRYNFLSFK